MLSIVQTWETMLDIICKNTPQSESHIYRWGYSNTPRDRHRILPSSLQAPVNKPVPFSDIIVSIFIIVNIKI